jgi:UDP-N-acetylmuramoyl-L-alanyl-D-glutamate--2,6-diaminopimelate ligase
MGRADGTLFDVAVFTNLSRDHLDYHHTMESYFEAKRLFFDLLKPGGRAAIHLGDPWGRRLATQLPEALTYGEQQGDVRVLESELDLDGIRARFRTPRGELEVRSPLLGHYNLENLLSTVAAAEALELDPSAIERGLSAATTVPGRLERVVPSQGTVPFPALVDYAHTPDALEAALGSVRQLSDRRLAVVFGCGGERDRGKRPMMGEIAGRLSDLAVLTSDNPRGEDPSAILAEVEEGLARSRKADDGDRSEHRVEADRRRAIRLAVEHAVEGEQKGEPWLVVVAGKGHEATQDLGGEVVPFDDREELAAALDRVSRGGGADHG